MTGVSNSTPLIYLAAIGRFGLLQALYGRISIPLAVFDEVVTQGTGRWGAAETANANWIDRRAISDPSSPLPGPMGSGGVRRTAILTSLTPPAPRLMGAP